MWCNGSLTVNVVPPPLGRRRQSCRHASERCSSRGTTRSRCLRQRICGEERLEDALADIQPGTPGPLSEIVISALASCRSARVAMRMTRRRSDGHERLSCVVDQVDQYLMDLVGVGDDRWKLSDQDQARFGCRRRAAEKTGVRPRFQRQPFSALECAPAGAGAPWPGRTERSVRSARRQSECARPGSITARISWSFPEAERA